MPTSVTPLLPVGAGRTSHRHWPSLNSTATIGTTAGTQVTPRPGGSEFAQGTITSTGSGAAPAAFQDNVPCYDIGATGTGWAYGTGEKWFPLVTQLPAGADQLGCSCGRVVMFCSIAGAVGETGQDIGLQFGVGNAFGGSQLVHSLVAGWQFGPVGPGKVSFWSRAVNAGVLVKTDVAAGFMAAIDVTQFNQYEMRILSATPQQAGVIKCLVNGIQVLPDISLDPAAAVVPPPRNTLNGTLGYSFGLARFTEANVPHCFVSSLDWMTAPNEVSLL